MDSLDELKKHLDQNLESGKSHMGFEVPDNYFDSLHGKILEQVNEEKKPRIINFYKVSAVAASICVLIACVFLLNNNIGESETDFAMIEEVSFSDEESMDFILDSDLDEFTTDDFLELDNIDEILEDLEAELTTNNNY
ncbi:hypothetical protein N9B82_02250 [Saprospiraceae bacterium]|nr:hypothetical protein [Saprospiraceae bacterium]